MHGGIPPRITANGAYRQIDNDKRGELSLPAAANIGMLPPSMWAAEQVGLPRRSRGFSILEALPGGASQPCVDTDLVGLNAIATLKTDLSSLLLISFPPKSLFGRGSLCVVQLSNNWLICYAPHR